jgi:hypothetical protein
MTLHVFFRTLENRKIFDFFLLCFDQELNQRCIIVLKKSRLRLRLRLFSKIKKRLRLRLTYKNKNFDYDYNYVID